MSNARNLSRLPTLGAGNATTMKNKIINGSFLVWQRATSGSAFGYVTADRWNISGAGTMTTSKSSTPDSPGGNYSMIWTSGANGTYVNPQQALESANVYSLRGKTVTFSYWVKVTAGSYAGYQYGTMYYSNSTDALASQSTAVTAITTNTVTPTSSWQQFVATFTVPSDAVGLMLQMTTSATQNTGVAIAYADAQLEVGSIPTSFDQRMYGTELALCQRYAQKWVGQGGSTQGNIAPGISTGVGNSACGLNPVVPMRASPTVSFSSLIVSDSATYDLAVSAISVSNFNTLGLYLDVTHAVTASTYRPCFMRPASSTAGYLLLSSEL